MLTASPLYGQMLSVKGKTLGSRLGSSVDVAGDTNGDGVLDIVVGSPFEAGAGAARIVSGLDGSVLHEFFGTFLLANLGWSVAGAGDVNADGYADVILGTLDFYATNAVVRSGLDGGVLLALSEPEGFFGWSVDGAGDVNDDGYDDVIVGRPSHGGGTAGGGATVYSGLDGSVLLDLVGAGSAEGRAVAGAGDVDGDGVPDFILGDPEHDSSNGEDSGRARVFSGADGSVLHKFKGPSPFAQFGWSVSGAGDVDGDGCQDLIVGAPKATLAEVSVFSGRTGVELYRFVSPVVGDEFGLSVSGAGDLDRDGYDDFVAGAPSFMVASTEAGRVMAYSGLDGSVLARRAGRPRERLGHSVAGRGFLVVGAPRHDVPSDDALLSAAGRVVFGRQH
jgi:hypothetical protein